MNRNYTSVSHVDDPRCPYTQIDYAPLYEWSTVIDATDHTFSVACVRNADAGIEWECLVRARDTTWIEPFSVSGKLALPVKRSLAAGDETGRLMAYGSLMRMSRVALYWRLGTSCDEDSHEPGCD